MRLAGRVESYGERPGPTIAFQSSKSLPMIFFTQGLMAIPLLGGTPSRAANIESQAGGARDGLHGDRIDVLGQAGHITADIRRREEAAGIAQRLVERRGQVIEAEPVGARFDGADGGGLGGLPDRVLEQ